MQTSSQIVAQWIEHPEAREACLGYLVESLLLANLNAPDRWGLVWLPSALQLRVGRITVLAILPGAFHCVADRAQIPALVRRDDRVMIRESSIESGHGVYESVRGSACVDCSAQVASTVFPTLQAAHRFLVVKAGLNCRNALAVTPHDPAALGALSELVGRSLPMPSRSCE